MTKPSTWLSYVQFVDEATFLATFSNATAHNTAGTQRFFGFFVLLRLVELIILLTNIPTESTNLARDCTGVIHHTKSLLRSEHWGYIV